jgi:hypothetical protein
VLGKCVCARLGIAFNLIDLALRTRILIEPIFIYEQGYCAIALVTVSSTQRHFYPIRGWLGATRCGGIYYIVEGNLILFVIVGVTGNIIVFVSVTGNQSL